MRQKYLPFFVIFGIISGGVFEYASRHFATTRPKDVENITVKPALLPQEEFVTTPVDLVTSKTISVKGPRHLRNALYFFTPQQVKEFTRFLSKMNVNPREGHKLFFSVKQHGEDMQVETLHYYLKDYYLDIKIKDKKFTASKAMLKREMKCISGYVVNSFYNSAVHIGTPSSVIAECVSGLKQNHTTFKKGSPFKIIYDVVKMPNGYETRPSLRYIECQMKGAPLKLYYFEQKSGYKGFFDEKGVLFRQNSFQRPLKSRVARISSGFGWRIHPITGLRTFHKGIDYNISRGSDIIAAAPGRVIFASWNGGYGRVVDIAHGNGYITRYAHMSKILVKRGQFVDTHATIGKVGSSGLATGAHLHFEIRKNNQPLDPKKEVYLLRPRLYGVDYKNFSHLKRMIHESIHA
ncbi:MAG: M23 family metallopeptidase [Alphaproteobacteria bacterium]|nr:MAG: M23 family metallopeptidase [Alphaproteobacteria bacterium]